MIPSNGSVGLGLPRPAGGVMTIVTGGVCTEGGSVALLGATPLQTDGGIEVTDAVVVPTRGVLTGVYRRALADTPYSSGSRTVTTECGTEPYPTLVLEVDVTRNSTATVSAGGFDVVYGTESDPQTVSCR